MIVNYYLAIDNSMKKDNQNLQSIFEEFEPLDLIEFNIKWCRILGDFALLHLIVWRLMASWNQPNTIYIIIIIIVVKTFTSKVFTSCEGQT